MNMNTENWADIDDDNEELLPPRTEKIDKNGIKTIVTYHFDKKKRTVKTTKRVKVFKLEKRRYHAAVKRRATWKKFGDCEGMPAGPNSNTTIKYQGEPIKMEDPNVVLDEVRVSFFDENSIARYFIFFTYRMRKKLILQQLFKKLPKK